MATFIEAFTHMEKGGQVERNGYIYWINGRIMYGKNHVRMFAVETFSTSEFIFATNFVLLPIVKTFADLKIGEEFKYGMDKQRCVKRGENWYSKGYSGSFVKYIDPQEKVED